MSYRLFEGKDHASIYQKYRFTPPDELKKIILQYLDTKVWLNTVYSESAVHYVIIVHIGPFNTAFCLFGEQNCQQIKHIC